MENLNSILPYELIHRILMVSMVYEIKERKDKSYMNIFKKEFKELLYFKNNYDLPIWLIENVVKNKNNNLYWELIIRNIDYIIFKKNNILNIKYVNFNKLEEMCIENKILKINKSRKYLINLLMKI